MYQVGVAQGPINARPDDTDASRRIVRNELIGNKIATGFGGANTPGLASSQRAATHRYVRASYATYRSVLASRVYCR